MAQTTLEETLLTPEQRAVLIKYLSPFGVSLVHYEVEPFRAFSFTFSKPRIVERSIDLPAEPSVEEVIEHLKRMSVEKQEAESRLQKEMQLYTTAIEEKAKKRAIEQAESLNRVFSKDKLLDALDDAFDEILMTDVEEANAILQEAGLDPDEVGASLEKVAKQALEDSPLNPKNL